MSLTKILGNSMGRGQTTKTPVARTLLVLLVPVLLAFGMIGAFRPNMIQAAPPDTGAKPVLPPAPGHPNPNLLPPSNLQTVSLDSTIHVTFNPSPDPLTAWHVMSVWDNGTLEQAKVVGKTSSAVQANGLVPDHTYTINVQAMDAAGNLSTAISTVATTDRQSPMRNAAFFENFNGPAGDLDYNYFDVRTSHGNGLAPESIGTEKMQVFNNENHFHTQMIGGVERGELYIRPRVPFDFANRTGTLQVEVDNPPVMHSQGKWFEFHLVHDVPWSSEEFGAGDGQAYPNSVEFSLRAGDGPNPNINLAQITVNIGGQVLTFQGTVRQMTPTNIRVPVVIKVSQTTAEMFVNGVSVVRATGFTLPFTSGYWMLAHRAWYASRDTHTQPVILQLIHWETIQYDGPAGSYNPIVRTYLEPGCPGVVHNEHEGVVGCPKTDLGGSSPAMRSDFQVNDDASLARSARLFFNGTSDSGIVSANLNGHQFNVPTTTCCYQYTLNTYDVPTSWLVDGHNTLSFTVPQGTTGEISEVEMEVVYNEHRIMQDPAPVHNMPMLSASSMSFRFDHIDGDPMVVTGTTYLYNLGSTAQVPYTATVISTESPWLTVSPGSGVATSPELGGGMIPLVLRIDFTSIPVDLDGAIGVIKITGGNMPVDVAVLAVNDGAGPRPTFLPTFTGLTTTFNKDAIPDYHGYNNGTPDPTNTAQPTVTPGGPPTGTPTATRTPTRTRTPQATVTPGGPPTNTPGATDTPAPSPTAVTCDVTFSDVGPDYWAYSYISYMACNGYVSGYSDGTFRPGNNSTRGQLSKITVLGEGWAIDTTGGPHFSDVPESNPFYSYIETAYNHGVISGYSDGTFRWGNNVTRAQLSKIIVIAQNWPIDTTGGPHFTDVVPGSAFYEYIETAYNHGIISGYSDGTFRWGNNATRAQLSKIIYLALTSAR